MWVIPGHPLSNTKDQLMLARRGLENKKVELTVWAERPYPGGVTVISVCPGELMDAIIGLFPEMMED